jgi:hypothetical protein
MRLGSMPGIWLINEGLISFRILLANSGGAAEVSENPTFQAIDDPEPILMKTKAF